MRTSAANRRTRWTALLLAAGSASFAAPAVPAPPSSPSSSIGSLDVTKYGVVWRVPAMAEVKVESGLAFGDGERRFDLYRPPPATAGEPATGAVPVLVFVNVNGAPYQEWQIYRDWARLAAAHGIAGVVYQANPADASSSLTALLQHLRSRSAELGIDPARLAIWACSANVSLALPWLHAAPRPEVAAAVLYYGHSPVAQLRTDLPVFYVLAGRDSAMLKAGIRELFAQAVREAAPWTMIEAPTLPHAFDALDEGVESRRLVKQTVAWLVDHLVVPPPAGPAPDLARQALTASYGQDWAAAETALRAMLLANPGSREALMALGSVLARSGASAAAIPVLRQAIALGEEGAGVHLNLGQALVRTGALDEGFAELARAVAAGANAAFVYNQLGVPAMQRGDMAAAIRIWEGALAATAALPQAGGVHRTVLYNLACAHARAGQRDAAFERLGQAIASGFGPRAVLAEDEDLISLRADPRFAALLERVAPSS
jgi:dienelactone hydrolase